MSLYLKDHIKNKSLKIILPVLMLGYAGYVSYTRVNEHFHHFSDVLTGAVSGTTITYFTYKFFQNSNRKVGFSVGRKSLNLDFRF